MRKRGGGGWDSEWVECVWGMLERDEWDGDKNV